MRQIAVLAAEKYVVPPLLAAHSAIAEGVTEGHQNLAIGWIAVIPGDPEVGSRDTEPFEGVIRAVRSGHEVDKRGRGTRDRGRRRRWRRDGLRNRLISVWGLWDGAGRSGPRCHRRLKLRLLLRLGQGFKEGTEGLDQRTQFGQWRILIRTPRPASRGRCDDRRRRRHVGECGRGRGVRFGRVAGCGARRWRDADRKNESESSSRRHRY